MGPLPSVCYTLLESVSKGKKEYTPPPRDPSFLGLSPDPEVAEPKKAMVYTIFLGKQGKRVYTIGPERRVYTIEPQTRKKKRRVSTVAVYTFFFPGFCVPCTRKPPNGPSKNVLGNGEGS